MRLNDIRFGTFGGTLVSIWASFSLGDLFQTMLSAVLGTVASYAVGWLIGKCRLRK
ncbi:MAG: hypothetical protein ACN6PN_08415 [Sphingobacterium sp.]